MRINGHGYAPPDSHTPHQHNGKLLDRHGFVAQPPHSIG